MKTSKLKNLPYMPRVVIKMNTGTRIILSKKDKASSRRALNRMTRELSYD